MPRSAAFCAPAVGTVWDGGVARFANGQRVGHLGCICVLGAFQFSGGAVLSVAKLTLGQEAYYERQVARGLDDYYAGRGESPGIWAGSGSAGLGLVDVVGDEDLGTLLRGVNPANEEQLRSPVRERTISKRKLDVETGEWREEPQQLKPVSGYDLVFSCPKSVSLLHALTDDGRVRREISEAHEAAWQAALAYLEREACIVRRGKGGHVREHGAGFVAAAFRHRTSRAQDPHLHTHVIVANMTRTADGEWRALDGEAILKTYRLAAGYLYEAQLRHELSIRLGLAWTEPVKGMGEFVAVREEAIRAFSTRRRSLLEHMEALGTEGFAASRVAALATREAKEQVELPRLREEWKARAAEHGLGHRELEALVRGRSVARDRVEAEQLGALLLGSDGLTEKQTTFTTPELVQAVAGSLPAGGTVDEVLELADELSRFPGVELLEDGGTPGRPARFTTRELLTVEREALELALARRDVPVPIPERRLLAEALMRSGRDLTGEQRMLVHQAATRPDLVICVAGVAGSGKTLALRALADAYRGGDVVVLGAAPSGRAADELQAATGIPSRTLHRLLLAAHRDGGLPHGCVLVVDEAAMAETRVLAPLLRAVDRAEGKLLLVGDPGQLPAVGAGGLYAALGERLGALELTGNLRQRDPLQREALARLRAGDPEPYLAHAARQGRLAVDDDATAAKERLLADWWREARRSPARTVMLAYHRSDVDELNQAAHALMLHQHRLGRRAVTLGEREYRVSDQVLCRRNDSRLGLRNGMRGTVVDLDHEALIVRDHSGADRRVSFAYAAEHLDYGYALTGHAAQGLTVDHALVLLPDRGALQEWGYVACSRARLETRLYLADCDTLERETPLRESDPAAPPERAARALHRSTTEPLALDQRRQRPDTIINYVAQQQAQLDRNRKRTVERLAAAQRELHHLHWWNGDRRAELKAEIALHRAALKRADAKREQLRQLAERRSRMLFLPSEHNELAPSLRPEPPRPRLEREPPGLGLEL
jgi:conjugative relaxase-like TrwC/TraI family protein